ncbi:MAG: type I polyketide synthase [Deltaproteobacteria bacterium]|jgi:acyl transferase domain-containing protein|nr:type I polyketide synthase [Deltaproteobacteria bacterium]
MTSQPPSREQQLELALGQAREVIRALTLERTKEAEVFRSAFEPVAVIGLDLLFPAGDRDAQGLAEFHSSLIEGVVSVRDIPEARRKLWQSVSPENSFQLARASILKREPFKADLGRFNLTPAEARLMDPQTFLALETVTRALDNAGLDPETLAGTNTAVYFGKSGFDFFVDYLGRPENRFADDPYSLTGNMASTLPGRISYHFDFLGPSVFVETACSTGLVAVAQAVRALHSGAADLAVAGAVNLILGPTPSGWLAAMKALAPDGLCRAFGADASGFGRGEGSAAVILTPLSRALAKGDRILAVIEGIGEGCDGRSSGFTVTSSLAQKMVLRKALKEAGLEPSEVGYVETHGTGTPLGDPIEVESLKEVYGVKRPYPLLIGSVKSNFGHLEAVAGLASLIKAIGLLRENQIPPSLHCEELNPLIDFGGQVEVNRGLRAWPDGYARKIAGVSSFSLTGALVHLLVSEPPSARSKYRLDLSVTETEAAGPNVRSANLYLSAPTPGALRAEVRLYREKLLAGADFTELARGSSRRPAGRERLVLTSDSGRAASDLASFLRTENNSRLSAGRAEKLSLLWVFGGQEPLAPGLSRELSDCFPVFKERLLALEQRAFPVLGLKITEIMFQNYLTGSKDFNRSQAFKPAVLSEVCLFAFQAATAALLSSQGLKPEAVMGHGQGEYAALSASGLYGWETGLDLVMTRAKMASELESEALKGPKVAWATVLASAAEVNFDRPPQAYVIAENGPASVTVAAPAEVLKIWLQRLAGRGLAVQGPASQPLQSSRLYHSPFCEPLLGEFSRYLRQIKFNRLKIPYLSASAASYLDQTYENWADYLAAQTCGPVLFHQALLKVRQKTGLEIGPAQSQIPEGLPDFIRLTPVSPGRELEQYLLAMGQLWSRGGTAKSNPPGPVRPEILPPILFEVQDLSSPFAAEMTGAAGAAGSSGSNAANDHELFGGGLKADPLPAAASGESSESLVTEVPLTGVLPEAAGSEAALELAELQLFHFNRVCRLQMKAVNEACGDGNGDNDCEAEESVRSSGFNSPG